MTSGQKVAFSLLISVLAFCAFTVVAFSGLFDLLEVTFYQPVVQEITQKKLAEIGAAQDEYFDTLIKRFDEYVKNPDVKSYLDSRPSAESQKSRDSKLKLLYEETSSLKGVRIIDKNGRNVHFSTFSEDLISNKKGLEYRRYDTSGEVPFSLLQAGSGVSETSPSEQKCRIIKDGEANVLIYSVPLFDRNFDLAATVLFYCSASDFSHFLFNKGLTDVNGFASLITGLTSQPGFDGFGGFVFGLPNLGNRSVKDELIKKWKENTESFWRIAPQEEDGESQKTLCVFSYKPSREDFGYIAMIYDDSELKFPQYMRFLLLATAFITFYLGIFLILSFRHDDIVIIRDRVRRYENEFFLAYQKQSEKVDSAYLASQKSVLEQRILKSLGRKGEKHASEFKSIFESYWQEMCRSFVGLDSVPAGASPISAAELKAIVRSSLEDILENGKIQINAASVVASTIQEENKKAEKIEVVETVDTAETENTEETESVEEIESLEEAEEAEEIEEAEDAEEVEETEEVQPAEEIEEIEEIEEAETAEEAESVEEIESLEEVEEIEDAEEIEEVEEAEEVQPAEEIEEIEEAEVAKEAESVEEIESLEEVEEIGDAEEIEEVEEAEEVQPAEEIEEAEVAEDAESVEEIESLEEVEEIEDAEEIGDAEEIEEVEEAEEVQPAEEIEEIEKAETAEEVESVEEIEPLEDLAEVDEKEYQAHEMALSIAALPEKTPDWGSEENELDEEGLRRRLSYSEMHDIEKLREAAKSIDAQDARLEELEPISADAKDDSDAEDYIPGLMSSDELTKDDVYKDEALLEKIEFGVPSSDIFEEITDDTVAERFEASPLDYSFLDDDDSDESMYKPLPQVDVKDSEHFFENPEPLADNKEESAESSETVEGNEEIETIEDADEPEALESPEENMPFMFTQFGATANAEIQELKADVPDAIVQESDGTFRVTDFENKGDNLSLDMEFKKLVDSILR